VLVRLGDQQGARRIQPFLAAVRHVLLHMHGMRIEPGLWRLNSPGFEVYTSIERNENFTYRFSPDSQVYAVFDIVARSGLVGCDLGSRYPLCGVKRFSLITTSHLYQKYRRRVGLRRDVTPGSAGACFTNELVAFLHRVQLCCPCYVSASY
jgi:hypothetical protein